jgi:hypothetical protein
LPSSSHASGKLNVAGNVIHSEAVPEAKTSPGPPTKPKPLMMLDIVAKTITVGPRLLPAI